MELRESLAQAREQQRYEDQEKRLLARLESLCLDAGRRNSQHEQQKVEKSLEEIPRGSEVRRRLRLSFVDPESLEKGVGGIKKEEQQRARQECDSRSKKVEARKAELQEVLEKERAFQREPFEGRRVAKEEQKQVEEEQCRAEVAQRSAELVVAEVEATWTVTVEQPVIDMIQFKGGEHYVALAVATAEMRRICGRPSWVASKKGQRARRCGCSWSLVPRSSRSKPWHRWVILICSLLRVCQWEQ